jgi:hypothetical protein
MLGRLLVAWLAAVVYVTSISPAAATQSYCESVYSQLADLPARPGQDEYLALLAQLSQAQADHDRLSSRLRELNCFALFPRFASPQCPAVRRALSDLRATILNLQNQTRTADPLLIARGNIVTLLQQNGCPVLSMYRTVCVRPTDGYFYPLAHSVRPENFPQYELVCRAQCEGARLFVHRNPGEGIENAVDLQGERYVDLPNAFAFREAYDPFSTCRPSPSLMPWLEGQLAALGVDPLATATPEHETFVPLPRQRPQPDEDPETIDNRLGGFVPTPDEADGAEDRPGLVGDGGVRVIGSAFYYANRQPVDSGRAWDGGLSGHFILAVVVAFLGFLILFAVRVVEGCLLRRHMPEHQRTLEGRR